MRWPRMARAGRGSAGSAVHPWDTPAPPRRIASARSPAAAAVGCAATTGERSAIERPTTRSATPRCRPASIPILAHTARRSPARTAPCVRGSRRKIPARRWRIRSFARCSRRYRASRTAPRLGAGLISNPSGGRLPPESVTPNSVETGTNRWLTSQLRVAISEKSASEQATTSR